MKANKVLLALPILIGLAGCAKTTTTKATTTNKPTTKQTTIEKTTTEKKTTTRRTTTEQTTTQYVSTEKMTIYCWNSAFQDILNKYYTNVKRINGSQTILKNGLTIQWTVLTNQSGVYQAALDDALGKGLVDMYMYEAPYAKKYVYSEYVVDMETLGVDQSDQFQYTKDVVTNLHGKLVGSTWYACPGVMVYNKSVAEAVWPGVTHAQMEEKVSSYSKFMSASVDVIDAGKQMMIHPESWYMMYYCNLDNRMYDGTRFTVDKNLFRWVNDTISLANYNGFVTTKSDEGLWTEKWGMELNSNNALCGFTTAWINDYSLPAYRMPDDNGDSGLRVVPGFLPWYWDGAYISATPVALTKNDVKEEVANIFSELTTNSTVLREISDRETYFTNSITAMTEKANDNRVANIYFGGQNEYKEYVKAALLIDASKEDFMNQRLFEDFQAAFIGYINGTKTAAEAWADLKSQFLEYFPMDEDEFKLPDGITINDKVIFE